jgi:hypothetical protein
VIVSVSTPLELDGATVDGGAVRNLTVREYGRFTHSASIVLAPGTTQVLELRLHGQLQPGQPYSLTVVPRANASTERFSATVDVVAGWTIDRTEGLNLHGKMAELSEDLVSRRDIRVLFQRS